MASTSSRPLTRAGALRAAALNLPDDLWIEILGFVGAQDAASMGRALCATRWMAAYAPHAWRAAVVARWPAAAAVAAAAGRVPCWRKLYEMLALRQVEADAAAAVAAAACGQAPGVADRHRAVLVEWLAEVSWDWGCESTVLFRAVAYLDAYVAAAGVEHLGVYQLYGIAALRAAMADAAARRPAGRAPSPSPDAPAAAAPPTADDASTAAASMDPIFRTKELAASRFAHISDSAYTPAAVDGATLAVTTCSAVAAAAAAPPAKTFLRSLWYAAVADGAVDADAMHVYTLASFFAQLALVDARAARLPPSAAAAGSISLALELAAGTDGAWPACLARHTGISANAAAAARAVVRSAAATVDAPHLRAVWVARHEVHGYPEYGAEWEAALAVMRAPGGVAEVEAAAGVAPMVA